MQTFVINPETGKETITDQEISEAIKRQFSVQKGVNSRLIDLKTENGIVSLGGFTDHLLSQERASQIAKMVRGVRGVINKVLVHTPEVPDYLLQYDVEQALLADPATADLNITCLAQNGIADLSGKVQSWPEKELVLKLVKGVKGVWHVNDNIETIPTLRVEHSDADLAAQIRERLQWDIRVNSALVDIKVKKSEVTLKGIVGSAAEKKQAIATAFTAGAIWVDSQDLHVEHWALNEDLRQDKYDRRTNNEIKKAIRDTFLADPRVLVFQPIIEVDNGTVTLTGTVSNLRAKRAAEQDALNVVGVWNVINHLKVQPFQVPSDKQIEENIKAALARCVYVSRFLMDTQVSQGSVSIYGTVGNHFEQQQVEEVTSGITGVVEVFNRVEVRDITAYRLINHPLPSQENASDTAENPSTDQQMEYAIRKQIFWCPFINENKVRIRVSKGCARFTGQVDNWNELRHLTLLAYECGATQVDNQMQVANGQAVETMSLLSN
jgi:osmotically-inducible protein OsmY